MKKRFVNATLESRVNTIAKRHASRSALEAPTGEQPSRWFHFQNADSDDEASLYIYDQISAWWGVGANDFVTALNEVEAKTLNVHINSPGGSVFEGFAIYSALVSFAEDNGATINVIVDGWAASIASVIAMAGDHIAVGEHASIMIHKPSSLVWGNADEMRDEADVLDEIEEAIIDIYVARTEGDRKQIQKWVADETWFRGQKAVDEGFADKVIALKKKKKDGDAEDSAKPAASKGADYFAAIFPNMPDDVREALSDVSRENKPGTTLPKTEREFKNFLREHGFSATRADAIAGNGFKPKEQPRDVAPGSEKPTTTDPRDGAEKRDEAVSAIKRAATVAAIRAAART